MYAAYFDRSGAQEHDNIVVAGLAAPTRDWLVFEPAWQTALQNESAPYFHAREFAHSVGAFKDWKNDEPRRRRLISALVEAMGAIKPFAIVVHVLREGFAKANAEFCLAERYSNAFVFAGRECAEYVRDHLTYGETYPIYAPVEYVFDHGETGWGSLCEAFIEDNFPIPIQKRSRDHSSGERGLIQLQAADFLAYESFKMFAFKPQAPQIRKSAELLFGNVWALTHVYGAFEIGYRCEERGIPRRKGT